MILSDSLWDSLPEGFYERGELEALLRYCTGTWCEVGCWHGRSTRVLAESGHKGYAVDWFKGSPEHEGADTLASYEKTMAECGNVVTVVGRLEDVSELVPSGLRLLHLDADHSFEATTRAFALYSPKVRAGGHVAIHDGVPFPDGLDPWPGVTTFCRKLSESEKWTLVEEAGRLAVFKRNSL